MTRRPRIRFAGPRRRIHHQNRAYSRRPSTGPSTASRPRDFRGRSTASRRQTPAPRKSMNRAAAGRTRRSPRPAASRGSRRRRRASGKRRLVSPLARRRRHLRRDDKVLVARALAGNNQNVFVGIDELGLARARRVLHLPAEVLVEFSYAHERDARRPFRLASRRARRVQQHAQIFENSHFCGVLHFYCLIRRWRRYDDDSCDARRVARAPLYSFGRHSKPRTLPAKQALP